MKSKEDILKDNVQLYFSSDHDGKEDGAEWHTNNATAENIYTAMDQYSEQIAIGFSEWIAANARGMYDHKMKLKFWVIGSGLNEESKSTPELYNIYKQILK